MGVYVSKSDTKESLHLLNSMPLDISSTPLLFDHGDKVYLGRTMAFKVS